MFSSQQHTFYDITKRFEIANKKNFQKKFLTGNFYMANIVCKKWFLFQVEIKEKYN
jgi:hypothetical protein